MSVLSMLRLRPALWELAAGANAAAHLHQMAGQRQLRLLVFLQSRAQLEAVALQCSGQGQGIDCGLGSACSMERPQGAALGSASALKVRS